MYVDTAIHATATRTSWYWWYSRRWWKYSLIKTGCSHYVTWILIPRHTFTVPLVSHGLLYLLHKPTQRFLLEYFETVAALHMRVPSFQQRILALIVRFKNDTPDKNIIYISWFIYLYNSNEPWVCRSCYNAIAAFTAQQCTTHNA